MSKAELAKALRGACINQHTFKLHEGTCGGCGCDVGNGCGEQQTTWLLKEYQEPIDWSHCGAIVILKEQNSIMNGDVYMVNGSFKGKLYLIDSLGDYKKTERHLPSCQIVPKSVLTIDDKEGETYKYYEYKKA